MQDIFVPSHVSAGFFFPQKESVQVFVKLCYIGRFQKISILYHGWLLGFLKGRGGSRLWNSEGMGGYLRFEI